MSYERKSFFLPRKKFYFIYEAMLIAQPYSFNPTLYIIGVKTKPAQLRTGLFGC
jgi:hypothetical protein